MATAKTPEERAARFAASEAAGLSAEDDKEALKAKAEALEIDAHWMIPRGKDVHGQTHEISTALAVVHGIADEKLEAEMVEVALRLVIGEAIVKRTEDAG